MWNLQENSVWSNVDNNTFYESIDVDNMQRFAKRSGLEYSPDFQLLVPYLAAGSRVLEVGAGYGRFVDKLLQFGGLHVTAVERSQSLHQHLVQRFCGAANLVNQDIMQFNVNAPFEVITLMWTMISDFSPVEQPALMQHLASMLCEGGVIAIETYAHDRTPVNASQSKDNKHYHIAYGDTQLCGYSPSVQQIKSYGIAAGLKPMAIHMYQVEDGRKRVLVLLTKPGRTH